jgi:hypothetical protein
VFTSHPCKKKEATPNISSRDSFCPDSLFLFPGQQGLDKVWAFFLGITVQYMFLWGSGDGSPSGGKEEKITWGNKQGVSGVFSLEFSCWLTPVKIGVGGVGQSHLDLVRLGDTLYLSLLHATHTL